MKVVIEYGDHIDMLYALKVAERAIEEGIELNDLWGYWNADTGVTHSVKRNKESIRVFRNSSTVLV